MGAGVRFGPHSLTGERMTREQEETVKSVRDQHPDVQALPYFRGGIVVLIQDNARAFILPNGVIVEKVDG